jgi:hypothetical protein
VVFGHELVGFSQVKWDGLHTLCSRQGCVFRVFTLPKA